jgi:hypothetical protein
MIQVVQNGRRFAFYRDLLKVFPEICGRASIGMSQASLAPAVQDFATHCGATLADFTRAFEALSEFLNVARSTKYGPGDLAAAYVDSGLSAVSQPALICMFWYIGSAAMQQYWTFLREALPIDAPTPGGDALLELLARSAHVMRAPTAGAAQRRAQEAAEHNERTRTE